MNNDNNTYNSNSNNIEEDQPSQDTNTSNNDYNLSQESEPPLQTSDIAQPTHPHNPIATPPTTDINIICETIEKRNIGFNNDLEVQTRLIAEGRVFNYSCAKQRKCMIIKITINTNANTKEPPTYKGIEQVIYSLIAKANLDKPIDIVAIFNFADPIPTKGGAIYITYAFISPRSTQQRIHNQYTPFYMVMHSRITDQLLLPTPTYKKDTNMPP
jgi:hypothetical protein